MDKRALDKAHSRLRVVKTSLHYLEQAKSYQDFVDRWYVFLVSAKNIYTVLQQGAKTSPQSRQWFAEKVTERKSDPLLQYIYEARNDDEHGLKQATEFVSGSLKIGVAKPGYSRNIMLDGELGSSGGSLHVTSLDNKPVLVEQVEPHVKLIPVEDRHERKYAPPSSHLGQSLPDVSPTNVARLAHVYLEKLVNEAARLA